MDASYFDEYDPNDNPEKKHKRPVTYTPAACLFCQRRHIKCDSGVPCFQCSRRGLKCEYKPVTSKRGPKPGSVRDTKQKPSSNQVGKLVHQLEKQRLTIDYWRAKYFELRGIMPDDTPKMAGGLPGAFLAQPYTQTTNDPELLLRTSYAFDAVVAYLHGLNLAIPNTFVFNEAKTFDYWELLESSHTLELPSIEKALDIFLHCVVFAHGCRLRGKEDKAVYFGTKADEILHRILGEDAASISSAPLATTLISSILVHVAFHGSIPNSAYIKYALDHALSLINKFKGQVDPIIIQRVYAQLVGTQQSLSDRWSFFDLALATDSNIEKTSSGSVVRDAFALSNRAIMCLVFSNSLKWWLDEETSPNDPKIAEHMKLLLKYTDETEAAIDRFEATRALPSGKTVFINEDLLHGYRIIVHSTKGGVLLTSGTVNEAVATFAKCVDSAKKLKNPQAIPLIGIAIGLLYAAKLLYQLNSLPLFDEAMSILQHLIRFHPVLSQPWKIVSKAWTNKPGNLNLSHGLLPLVDSMEEDSFDDEDAAVQLTMQQQSPKQRRNSSASDERPLPAPSIRNSSGSLSGSPGPITNHTNLTGSRGIPPVVPAASQQPQQAQQSHQQVNSQTNMPFYTTPGYAGAFYGAPMAFPGMYPTPGMPQAGDPNGNPAGGQFPYQMMYVPQIPMMMQPQASNGTNQRYTFPEFNNGAPMTPGQPQQHHQPMDVTHPAPNQSSPFVALKREN